MYFSIKAQSNDKLWKPEITWFVVSDHCSPRLHPWRWWSSLRRRAHQGTSWCPCSSRWWTAGSRQQIGRRHRWSCLSCLERAVVVGTCLHKWISFPDRGGHILRVNEIFQRRGEVFLKWVGQIFANMPFQYVLKWHQYAWCETANSICNWGLGRQEVWLAKNPLDSSFLWGQLKALHCNKNSS